MRPASDRVKCRIATIVLKRFLSKGHAARADATSSNGSTRNCGKIPASKDTYDAMLNRCLPGVLVAAMFVRAPPSSRSASPCSMPGSNLPECTCSATRDIVSIGVVALSPPSLAPWARCASSPCSSRSRHRGGSVSVRQSICNDSARSRECMRDLVFLLGNFPLAQALPKIFAAPRLRQGLVEPIRAFDRGMGAGVGPVFVTTAAWLAFFRNARPWPLLTAAYSPARPRARRPGFLAPATPALESRATSRLSLVPRRSLRLATPPASGRGPGSPRNPSQGGGLARSRSRSAGKSPPTRSSARREARTASADASLAHAVTSSRRPRAGALVY